MREDALRIAHKIAKEIGAEVIELSMIVDKCAENSYQTASPEEYIGLFKHADFVVTSSFTEPLFRLFSTNLSFPLRREAIKIQDKNDFK